MNEKVELSYWKLPERLQELREKHNLNPNELVKKIGVTRTAIIGWEQKGLAGRIDSLAKVADLFDVSIDYLIGREDGIKKTIKGEKPSYGDLELLNSDDYIAIAQFITIRLNEAKRKLERNEQ